MFFSSLVPLLFRINCWFGVPPTARSMKAHYHTLVSSGVKPKHHCGSRSLLCGSLTRPRLDCAIYTQPLTGTWSQRVRYSDAPSHNYLGRLPSQLNNSPACPRKGLVAVIAPPAILTASSTVHRTSEMAKGYSNMPRQVKAIKVPALALLMPSAYVLCIRENLRKTRAGI